MPLKLQRYQALISGTEPNALEAMVRGLLIQYFFHISNKQIIHVRSGQSGASNVVNLLAPTVFKGRGRIVITSTTVFGWTVSPGSYSCSYIEARNPNSTIEIGESTTLNNNAVLISEGAGIFIGARCLIGTELQILDTNAHELELGRRHMPDSQTRRVVVSDDVFIGSRVTLLKGCKIGNGCVIAAGSVVPPSFEAPPMSVVAGNPARVIGEVPGSVAGTAAERG